MKMTVIALLALASLAGCARFSGTSSTPSDYPGASPRPAGSAAGREASSSDCRGVYDQLAKVCIGG